MRAGVLILCGVAACNGSKPRLTTPDAPPGLIADAAVADAAVADAAVADAAPSPDASAIDGAPVDGAPADAAVADAAPSPDASGTTQAFTIDVTAGLGDIVVDQPNRVPWVGVQSCTSSCTLMVDPSVPIELLGTTPLDTVDFSAPCTPLASTCTLPAGTTGISVAFGGQPGERDLRLAVGVESVDYDAAGDLVVGGTSVTLLSPALAVQWTQPLAGPARFDGAGDVFVSATDGIHKLAADGTPLWTHAPSSTLIDFDPTPSGGVVLLYASGFEILDASGGQVATPTLDLPGVCVATGTDDAVYVGVRFDLLGVRVEAFSAGGVRVLPDFPPTDGIRFDDEGPCRIAVGGSQLAVSEKGELEDWVGFWRLGLDRTTVDSVMFALQTSPDMIRAEDEDVAMNAGDQLAWFGPDATSDDSDAYGMHVEKRASDGGVTWTLDRPHQTLDVFGDISHVGLTPLDIAISPDGHVAVAARYYGPYSLDSVIEVFAP